MREWSACMKKSGYDYTKEDAVTDDLSKRLAKLMGSSADGMGGIFGATSANIDVPGLRKLQKDELAVAKVDWDCSIKHLGPRDEVAGRLNKEFIEQNRAALDSVRTALGG